MTTSLYPLAVTTIDATPVAGAEPPMVEFNKLTSATKDDLSSLLLKDVTATETSKDDMPTLRATSLTEVQFRDAVRAEAQRMGAKAVLISVHGYANTPSSALGVVRAGQERLGPDVLVIPVLWPCADADVITSYKSDRAEGAVGAASALRALYQKFARALDHPELPVSIIAHSMGNFVLRLFAPDLGETAGHRYEHIFMVAADVDWKIFDADRQEGGTAPDDAGEPGDGARIVGATKDLVHVLYSSYDLALVARFFFNTGITALGRAGFDESKVAADLKDKLVKVNAGSYSLAGLGFSFGTRVTAHSYQFSDDACAYYKSFLVPSADEETKA